MTTLRAVAVLATLALAIPVITQAQTTASGTVTGVIHAPDGSPLAGVEITLDRLGRTARSDAAGRWRLESVPDGAYRLVARRVGFAPIRRTVKLAAGTSPHYVDTLSYTGVRLDPSVVSARRQQFPGTLERVERGASAIAFAEDIAAIPTNLYDIGALLERSVPLRSRLVYTRGRPPSCGYADGGYAILVDGKRVPPAIPLSEWVRPYEIELFEISRGSAVLQDEHRRRAAGDTTGAKLDRRIGGCPWVWLIWTKHYTRAGTSDG